MDSHFSSATGPGLKSPNLGWKKGTPAKKYMFCLVSGKQRRPQKGKNVKRGTDSREETTNPKHPLRIKEAPCLVGPLSNSGGVLNQGSTSIFCGCHRTRRLSLPRWSSKTKRQKDLAPQKKRSFFAKIGPNPRRAPPFWPKKGKL